MEYLWIPLTLAGVGILALVYSQGKKHGYKNGFIDGKEALKKELLLMKDPEAWNMARTLELDEREKEEKSLQEKTTIKFKKRD